MRNWRSSSACRRRTPRRIARLIVSMRRRRRRDVCAGFGGSDEARWPDQLPRLVCCQMLVLVQLCPRQAGPSLALKRSLRMTTCGGWLAKKRRGKELENSRQRAAEPGQHVLAQQRSVTRDDVF